jgi:acetyltransferase
MGQPLVHRFHTRSGVPICVRRVEPGDAAHLLALFAAMSPESRYQRFAKVLEHPDTTRISQEAQAIAAMPPQQGTAWIAFADVPGQLPLPVGLVRYLLIADDTAEVDIVVADAYQRCGIGTHLSQLLVEQGRAAGIRKLTWVVQQSNHAMICMLARAPFPVKRRTEGDLIIVEAELPPTEQIVS